MTDIEKVCSRIMIIDHGAWLRRSLEQIRAEYGKQRTLVVDFEEEVQDFSRPTRRL